MLPFKYLRQDYWEAYEMGMYHEQEHSCWRVYHIIMCFSAMLMHEFLTAICTKYGHKWQLDSFHADGNSGSECYECTRCGKYIEHIYY